MIIRRIPNGGIVEKNLEPKNCYVCSKLIKSEKVSVGKGFYRHVNCVPGKSKWFKSQITKTTEKFYTKIKKEPE